MELTCRTCGFAGDYGEFKYLCKCSCSATGESDLRQCPRCGAECVFSRTEALEQESDQIEELSGKLAVISKTKDAAVLAEAKQIIAKLHRMNLRWNIPELNHFLLQRQKELFLNG